MRYEHKCDVIPAQERSLPFQN